MRRLFAYALVFLAITAEVQGEIYDGKWETPYTAIGTFLFRPSALKVPLWDIGVLVLLLAGLSRVKPARAMVRATWVSVGFVAFEWLWGIVTGGNVQQTLWQLHPFVRMFVVAFALASALDKPEHFFTLGKVVLWGAIYRAIMLFGFYELVVKETMKTPPPTLTTHHDTALFVTGMLIAIVWALEYKSAKNFFVALLPTLLVAGAIIYNNRRLAWVSLLGALVVMYVMMPKTKRKRRLTRWAIAALPFVAMYVIVGWDRTEPIFKFAHSLATMTGKEDASAATRDIENYNLIMTLKVNPIIGIGFGKEYEEVSVAYSIKQFFEQYRFIPHNSVLGLLGFTGLLGFAGIWSFLPVTGYLLARTVRFSDDRLTRMLALGCLAELAVFMNQLFGDMGLISTTTTVLMACAMSVAIKLGERPSPSIEYISSDTKPRVVPTSSAPSTFS